MSNIPKNQQDVLEFAAQGELEDGLLVMPKLWSVDKAGKYHWWQIKIGITYADDSGEIDPVNNEDDRIPVGQDEIERGELDEDAVGVFWTEFAQEGGKVQDPSPTYVHSGKNISRSNYTTPFTQAILDARKQYNLRIRRGNTPVRKHLIKADEFPSIEALMGMTHRGETPWRVFPMALHDVEKAKNWRHVQYPCDLQPKYDGTRFLVVQHPDLPTQEVNIPDGNVIEELPIDGYSRGLETYEGQDHILSEAMELLRSHPGLYLDGEIYKEGFSLQDISGTSRRQADSKRGAPELVLDYMIFDCFYTDKPDMPWSERRELLQSLFADAKWEHLHLAPVTEVADRKELDAVYRSYLDDGLEGAVIRNMDAPYAVGLSKEQRSYKVLKYKPRFDDEWPVVGYESGAKGKAVGAVVWKLAENDAGVCKRLKLKADAELPDLSKRLTFTSDMNETFAMRYAIYSYLEDSGDFAEKYYGKPMTVSYSILSNDQKPQQPKVLRFRDPKVQSELVDNASGYM